MKISKQQWQDWASQYAADSADDYARNVPLTVEQVIILKAKLEGAALYGMELAVTMDQQGYDTSEAIGLTPELMRGAPPPCS